MARKTPVLINLSFGAAAGVIPLIDSGLYNEFGFRTTLDVLGIGLTLNAIGFLVHAVTSNCGRFPARKQGAIKEKEEEQQPLILE